MHWLLNKLPKNKFRTPEFSSELVRLSDKVSSITSKTQIVKICGKYFKVKELG
jgi:hypothetical protein